MERILRSDHVLQWIDEVHDILEYYSILPEFLLNMDATMLEVGEGRVKVITHKGSPCPHVEKTAKSEHITLVLTISAAGTYFRPLCIFSLKTLPPLNPETEAFFFITGQENGFIDKKTYYNYLKLLYLEYLKNKLQNFKTHTCSITGAVFALNSCFLINAWQYEGLNNGRGRDRLLFGVLL